MRSDNYKITRISTEDRFHRIVHSMAEIKKDLLRAPDAAFCSKQDALIQSYTDKISLPIKEKKKHTLI